MLTDIESDFYRLPVAVRMSIVTALQAAIAAPSHFMSADEARDVLVTLGYPESAGAARKIAAKKR